MAQAVDLDMVQAGWRPTVESYLGRVPKRRILDAVQDGAGEQAAQLMDPLKKGDMAREAERLLADTGWLPEPLRIATADGTPAEASEAEDDGEALPEFLAGDDEEAEAQMVGPRAPFTTTPVIGLSLDRPTVNGGASHRNTTPWWVALHPEMEKLDGLQ